MTTEETPAKVANTAEGDVVGAQTGDVQGNVITVSTIYKNFISSEPELFDYQANEDEIDEVRKEFCEPAGFTQARQLLDEHSTVILYGRGSGRSFAALKLLTLTGCQHIVHLDHGRRLQRMKPDELEPGDGYEWRAAGPGAAPLTDSDFTKAKNLAHSRSCRLVIVVDQVSNVPENARTFAVELKPPDPGEVARAVIASRAGPMCETAQNTFATVFGEKLAPGEPPHKAVRAAELAIAIANGDRGQEEALRELTVDVDRAVTAIIRDWWTSVDYTMFLAVAFLEGKPFDQVARHAVALDRLARQAELPNDKIARPRKVFSRPKDDLLVDIGATTDLRNHSRHSGLEEQTVRFVRPDWADAVLCRFWQQYHLDHKLLLNWMCDTDEREAAVKALCTVTTKVPAHDPLWAVTYLANRNSAAHRNLAARTLVRLADTHELSDLVDQTLDEWTKTGRPNTQWTAALVYGGRFDKNPDHALRQLAEIARTNSERVSRAVIAAILSVLNNPEHGDRTVRAICDWVTDGQSIRERDNLRTVALELAMWLLGVRTEDEPLVDVHDMERRYPEELRELILEVADDSVFGTELIGHLNNLSRLYHPGTATKRAAREKAEFLRVFTLLSPERGWIPRFQDRMYLARRHALYKPHIKSIFRMARKMERHDQRIQQKSGTVT